MSFFLCPVNNCEIAFDRENVFLSHIRNDHYPTLYASGLHCQISGCYTVARSYHAFRMHLSQKHRTTEQFARISTDALTSTVNHLVQTLNLSKNMSCQNDLNLHPLYLTASVVPQYDLNIYKFCEKFFLFTLMLKEKHTLSLVAFKDIMENLIKMLSHLQCFYAGETDIEASPGPTLIDFESLWWSLGNNSVFKKFCHDIGYIEPEQVQLSSSQNDFYYYVPILKTLASYISHEDNFGSIDLQSNSHLDNPRSLNDYTNGELFKKNLYFKGDLSLLRLHLYCDEVEVCNPIRSSKGLYKLVCVYYTLGNIETRYWSKLRNIHVAVVAKFLLAKKHGYMAIFHKLKDDLITLEKDGILVKLCDGTSKIFHGGIATISGDNLSSHEIDGFRRCFNTTLIL